MSVLVDTDAAAIAVRRPASTIRRWATEGHLARHGTDNKRRTLVDLQQVYNVAATRKNGSPR